jgi:hypothetical protein
MNSKTMKMTSIKRIALGVCIGCVLLASVVWLLTLILGNTPRYVFEGKTIRAWQAQLNSQNTGTSNNALVLVNGRVIPQLIDAMFHDTNDSRLRIMLVDALNQLPGVQIYFIDAGGRRMDAAQMIGELGPGATAAIPALIQAVKGNDVAVRGAAIEALGQIHGEPDLVIPLLTAYLDDENVNDEAATALGNYGSLAKAAVPKIIPMLHAPDKDARAAAAAALKQIDFGAYTNATMAQSSTFTNGLSLKP